MPALAFLDGSFVPLAEARVSAFDAGLQHGVGLFETMLAGNGPWDDGNDVPDPRILAGDGEPAGEPWVVRLSDHLDRLQQSASDLGLSASLRAAALEEAILETVRRSALPRARVRVTITGGDLNLLSRGGDDGAPRAHSATVLIVAQPATAYPEAMYEAGVGVVLAQARANPLNPAESHKTLNYWWRLRELQAAAARRAAEAVVLQVTNHVAGGCVSNLFAVHGTELITPLARGDAEGASSGTAPAGAITADSLPSPVLPGITRKMIMQYAAGEGLKVRRRLVTVQDLLEADELFLTNSSWGVLPVVRLEDRTVGGGMPGEVTRDLRGLWLAEVAGRAS